MISQVPTDELTDEQFDEISSLVRSLCGINLHAGKRQLVRARLTKHLRRRRVPSFERYLQQLREDDTGRELVALLDVLSTNLTRFFRESAHFDVLIDRLTAWRAALPSSTRPRLRLWSAGCATGEEPYSLVMALCDGIADFERWDAKVLATDLSTEALATAREGVYGPKRLEGVPEQVISRHFTRVTEGGPTGYRVAEHIRSRVTFARLNLMEEWPMTGPFDAILCRNVMIYFDKPTQQRLVRRFWELLRAGGTLFIGHSESLTGVQHSFEYIQPTVYQRT